VLMALAPGITGQAPARLLAGVLASSLLRDRFVRTQQEEVHMSHLSIVGFAAPSQLTARGPEAARETDEAEVADAARRNPDRVARSSNRWLLKGRRRVAGRGMAGRNSAAARQRGVRFRSATVRGRPSQKRGGNHHVRGHAR